MEQNLQLSHLLHNPVRLRQACLKGLLTPKMLRIFACDCVQRMLEVERDTDVDVPEELWDYLRLQQQWIDGKLSTKDREAAYIRAKQALPGVHRPPYRLDPHTASIVRTYEEALKVIRDDSPGQAAWSSSRFALSVIKSRAVLHWKRYEDENVTWLSKYASRTSYRRTRYNQKWQQAWDSTAVTNPIETKEYQWQCEHFLFLHEYVSLSRIQLLNTLFNRADRLDQQLTLSTAEMESVLFF